MHIAFLTPEYPIPKKQCGGLGTYTKRAAIELANRGHKVSVFIESNRNLSYTDCGVSVYEIKCLPLYFGLNSKSIVKQLIRVLIILYSSYKVKIAVLNVHKLNSIDIIQSPNYLAPGYFLRNNKKIPFVSRVSSYDPAYHAAFGIPRSFGDYLIDYLELRTVADSIAGFSPSRLMVDIYERFESVKLDFVPTPIDLNSKIETDGRLLNTVLGKIKTKKYILYFGSLSRIKGVDLMADVINLIAPKYPEIGFVFIGKDYGLPNGLPISKFITEKCHKHVRSILFFDHQDHKYLYPVIKHALAVVAPSRIDNYPNTCLEAQHLGIPVVGTNYSSIEELIIDGETGFIAKNSSPLDIANKLMTLVKMDKQEILEMKKNIRKNIKGIISEDRIGKLLTFYEKISKK